MPNRISRAASRYYALVRHLEQYTYIESSYIESIYEYSPMISFTDVANKIIDFVVNGTAKGQAYDRLALFTDTFGNRISGSKNLENAIGE